jgi:hypothetical protein
MKREAPNGLSPDRSAGRQVAAVSAAAAGAGGALVATAASACCAGPVLAPLVVGLLGASGAAWAAGLKPYSAWILSGAAAMLAFGFFSVYRARPVCAVSGPRVRGGQVLVRLLLWVSAALWIAALVVNLVVPT